jgi:hypothetical protein
MVAQDGAMSRWHDVEAEVPELAERVRARFDLHGLALMATLRADGSPRISGVEPLFAAGELWLGMMDASRKGADVRRDPRLALHAATADKQVTSGDAKIAGRGVEVLDDDVKASFLAQFAEHNGYAPPPGTFELYTLDIAEISTLIPDGDHLVIEWWRPGEGAHRIERA